MMLQSLKLSRPGPGVAQVTMARPAVFNAFDELMIGELDQVCAWDLAIASDDASFAVSEAKFGILPAVMGADLVNAVGKRQALRLALSTSRIRAEEALAMGLVQQVVPAGGLEAAVADALGALTLGGPAAQREIKQLYSRFAVGPVTAEVRQLTAETIGRVRGTAEAKEGFAAFLAKRPPSWGLQ